MRLEGFHQYVSRDSSNKEEKRPMEVLPECEKIFLKHDRLYSSIDIIDGWIARWKEPYGKCFNHSL